MTAGDGYRYLLNSVVAGDGDRDAASALTRYYLEAGTLCGRKSKCVYFGLFLRFLGYRSSLAKYLRGLFVGRSADSSGMV